MEQPKQTYQLISITNTESYFKRENALDNNYLKATNNLDLNIAKNFENDQFGVFLTVHLKQEFEGKVLVEVKVTTIGVFKKTGDITQEALDAFCNVNAPAIIFPFVREIIANLSMKGGIQPIMIQPINFIELNKQEKK